MANKGMKQECRHLSCRIYETGTEYGEVVECHLCGEVLTKAAWMELLTKRTVKRDHTDTPLLDASLFYLIMYLILFVLYVLLGGN